MAEGKPPNAAVVAAVANIVDEANGVSFILDEAALRFPVNFFEVVVGGPPAARLLFLLFFTCLIEF